MWSDMKHFRHHFIPGSENGAALTSARRCGTHPQCRPITSRTKVRWWLWRDKSSYTETGTKNSLERNKPESVSFAGVLCCCLISCGVWPLCSGHDRINDVHDAMQCRVGPDGHVRSTEVVVDGADQAHDVQVLVLFGQSVCNPTWRGAWVWLNMHPLHT